jgi:Polymerase beta, Nucleotidyltransferase
MKFLDPDTESAVRDFLARIPGDIRLDRAILFGSRARGEHRPDNDADVALIPHDRGDDGKTLKSAKALSTGPIVMLCDEGASYRINRFCFVAFLTAASGMPVSKVTSFPSCLTARASW